MRNIIPRTLCTSILLLLALSLSGCGNKGDLYRPEGVVEKAEKLDKDDD